MSPLALAILGATRLVIRVVTNTVRKPDGLRRVRDGAVDGAKNGITDVIGFARLKLGTARVFFCLLRALVWHAAYGPRRCQACFAWGLIAATT